MPVMPGFAGLGTDLGVRYLACGIHKRGIETMTPVSRRAIIGLAIAGGATAATAAVALSGGGSIPRPRGSDESYDLSTEPSAAAATGPVASPWTIHATTSGKTVIA